MNRGQGSSNIRLLLGVANQLGLLKDPEYKSLVWAPPGCQDYPAWLRSTREKLVRGALQEPEKTLSLDDVLQAVTGRATREIVMQLYQCGGDARKAQALRTHKLYVPALGERRTYRFKTGKRIVPFED